MIVLYIMSLGGISLRKSKKGYELRVAMEEAGEWYPSYLEHCLQWAGIEHSSEGEGKGSYLLYPESGDAGFLDKYIARHNYLEYDECVRLLDCCSVAMQFLREKGLMYTNVDLGDFLKVGQAFVFLNFHRVFPLEEEHVVVAGRQPLHRFSSPEASAGGGRINITSTYYNVACILSYVCCEVYVAGHDLETIDRELGPIYYTKLYWFLMRCLEPEPVARQYLYV